MPLINVPTAPPTGAPTAATTTTASTTTAASTSTPDSGALEEQDGADFVVVDPGEYSYAFDASYSYSYAGTDSPGEMIFDAEFDFGEFTAPDEGAFNAEDTVLISEPVASDCAASCAGRRRLRFGSFRGVGDCECWAITLTQLMGGNAAIGIQLLRYVPGRTPGRSAGGST